MSKKTESEGIRRNTLRLIPALKISELPPSREDYPTLIEVNQKAQQDLLERQGITTSKTDLAPVSRQALNQIISLNEIAYDPMIWHVPVEIAQKPTLFFYPSRPGLYSWLRKRTPETYDRYHDLEFAAGMERIGADTVARLAIIFAGQYYRQKQEIYHRFATTHVLGFDESLEKIKLPVRLAVYFSPHRILYSGNRVETADTHKVLHTEGAFIPWEKVDYTDPQSTNNTVNQVQQLDQYLRLYAEEFEQLVICATAAQAVRIAYICQQQNAIPKDLQTFIFPSPIPETSLNIYPAMEIAGLHALRYSGLAADIPIRYSTPNNNWGK